MKHWGALLFYWNPVYLLLGIRRRPDQGGHFLCIDHLCSSTSLRGDRLLFTEQKGSGLVARARRGIQASDGIPPRALHTPRL